MSRSIISTLATHPVHAGDSAVALTLTVSTLEPDVRAELVRPVDVDAPTPWTTATP